MCSTHSDRSICTCKIDLSGCVVCVVHIQIDLSVRVRSGCVVCVVQIQIDLSVCVR